MKKPKSICFCKNVDMGTYINQVCVKTPFTYNLGSKDKNDACIDSCILSEIAYLWYNGVETLNSCCGHGKKELATVIVKEESIHIMQKLGYKETTLECANPTITFALLID